MASMALKFFSFIILSVLLLLLSHHCKANTWIRGGYWYVSSESPIPSINSALFTHLLCAFATVNSSSFELSIPESDEQYFSSFTSIVKRKNPSISTVLSIWNGQDSTAKAILGEQVDVSVLSSMISQQSYRKSFIRSSIKTARLYGFLGIDLFWLYPNTASDMTNLGFLLDEWREAINSEQTPEGQPKLTLSMAIRYLPTVASNSSSGVTYPVDSVERNLDWAHIMAYDYHLPLKQNHTGAHAALYDPSSNVSTNYGIGQWISKGLEPSKIVLGIPYHGYAWTLVDPKDGSTIGAPAIGPALTKDGSVSYQYIMKYIHSYGAKSSYNASYVANEYSFGSNWIGFDDVEAIRAKVSYAKQKGLLGYKVFVVTNDDNWELSQAAAQEGKQAGDKKRLLLIILLPLASAIILIIFFMFYLKSPIHMPQGFNFFGKGTRQSWKNVALGRKNSGEDVSGLRVFSYNEIKDATDSFSSRNLLGEGGFGPVYKGQLRKGEEIAVKILSRASTQGAEEFRNEVTLTASLQHVNLIRVIGYCTDREERALVYKFMPNRSLDVYLFDPERSHILDWEKRVRVIDGVIQGLLYLQEYSNFTIVHRDLKASNILLDENLNPKISDFGMAKLFKKDGHEANTERIVGTYGYVPPEYLKKGVYSIKYDVYSFGVLLLQIISGKRTRDYYGPYEDMNLYELAYELWRSGQGKEFMDPSLDDSSLSCKLMTCMQVALLCVQENPEDRPTMLEVFSMIKSNTLSISIPKKPAFALKKEQQTDTSTSQQEICSVGDASISQLFPR